MCESNSHELAIRNIELGESVVVWKLFETSIVIRRDCDAMTAFRIALIVINVHQEPSTRVLPCGSKFVAVFLDNRVSGIDNKNPIFNEVVESRRAVRSTAERCMVGETFGS